MSRFFFILAILACLCLGASRRLGRAPASASGSFAELGIRFLTNLNTTTDGLNFASPVFTPSSNNLIVVNMDWTLHTTSITNFSNTGSSNLTWWRAIYTNQSSARQQAIYVTALPEGTAPFSMSITCKLDITTSSMQMHIYEVTNANKTALWGSNAIAQANATQSTTDTSRFIPLSNAITAPLKSMMFAACAGSCSCIYTAGPPVVVGLQTSSSSPTINLTTFYQTNLPADFTGFWRTNTSGTANENACIIEIVPQSL